jgi:hypothetical protein
MKKNVASQSVGAEMITAADGTIFTGAVSVLVTINNGTQTAGGGTAPAHEGNGYHSYAPTQAETNGDHLAFTFIGTGAISATIQVYTTFPQTQDHTTPIANIDTVVDLIKVDTTAILVDTGTTVPNQISALNDFNPATDAVANVTLVGTTTTNTDMRGTNSALLAASYTAPDNTSITNILGDTNELQLNQGNWLTATGFSTSAEIAALNDITAADVWGSVTRTLTSGANIVLAKGIGLTGLNDIAATSIVSGGAITTTSGNASVDVVKINGTNVIGAGTSGNLWRA